MKYNLRTSVAVVATIVAFSPFIFLPILIPDPLERAVGISVQLQFFVPIAVGFMFFGMLLASRRFAEWCSRDVTRVAETIATARYCFGVSTVGLVAGLIISLL